MSSMGATPFVVNPSSSCALEPSCYAPLVGDSSQMAFLGQLLAYYRFLAFQATSEPIALVSVPTSPATCAPATPSPSSSTASPTETEERRPHQCPECLKRFRFKSNLFEHKTIHQDITPHVCPFCGKTCRLKGNLKKHLQVHVTSSKQLEDLWKARFSRSSGRPRKDTLLSM